MYVIHSRIQLRFDKIACSHYIYWQALLSSVQFSSAELELLRFLPCSSTPNSPTGLIFDIWMYEVIIAPKGAFTALVLQQALLKEEKWWLFANYLTMSVSKCPESLTIETPPTAQLQLSSAFIFTSTLKTWTGIWNTLLYKTVHSCNTSRASNKIGT